MEKTALDECFEWAVDWIKTHGFEDWSDFRRQFVIRFAAEMAEREISLNDKEIDLWADNDALEAYDEICERQYDFWMEDRYG